MESVKPSTDAKNGASPLPNEQLNDRQPWLPLRDIHPEGGLGYRSPLSAYDHLVTKLNERLAEVSDRKAETNDETALDPSYPVPPQWQAILEYLWKEGAIADPYVHFEQLFNDEPKMFSLRLWASPLEGKTDGGTESINSGFSRGVSLRFEEAFSKAIGEFLERYPLLLYRNKDLLRASIEQLQKGGHHFLDPSLLAGASEWQKQKFINRKFDKKSIFRWVRGKSLTRNCDALIPAQLIFWNYRLAPDEPFLQQPITNGAGGYFTEEGAILSGLYELIQRDAFFVFWFNELPPPRIDLASLRHPSSRELLRRIERYHIHAEVLDITSDFGVPAFAAALLDSSPEGPAVTIGGGCGPDLETAVLRALTEAVGVRHSVRMFGRYPTLPKPYEPFSIPLGQQERVSLWGSHAMRKKFDFFLQGPVVQLDRCINVLAGRAGSAEELATVRGPFAKRSNPYEIFYYRPDHPLLRTLGYHSAAVRVPALLPLYLNETCAPLGAERIREACRVMGYTPAEQVNPLPHPFP